MAPIWQKYKVAVVQGSFREHITSLKQIEGVKATEVRTKEELQQIDGLIIPGGDHLFCNVSTVLCACFG